MPEAGQGAVERVLYPCRLSGREERTEAHGVSDPGEEMAVLRVKEAGIRRGIDGENEKQKEQQKWSGVEEEELRSPGGETVGPGSRERQHAAAPTHDTAGGLGSAWREMA